MNNLRRLNCVLLVVVGLGLGACSPALNWRSLTPAPGLTILLPCKPDQRSEDVPLGALQARLDMLGCQADGMDFTFGMLQIPEAVKAEDLLLRWQQASLHGLHVGVRPEPSQEPIAGVSVLAQHLAVTAPNGQRARLWWWVYQGRAYQLAIYGPARAKQFNAAAQAFLAGVRQQSSL